MIRRSLLPALLAVVLTAAAEPGSEYPLVLRDGDRVLFLGNTFFERDNHYAYLETLLALRHPGKTITFRNMGWSGDTVDVQMRPLNFGTVEEHVRAYAPTVTFVCYGMSESFQGESGLPAFIQHYATILDYLQPINREVVLISPIRHENLGPPLPDPSDHNAQLRLYVDAIEDLAQERGCMFVNLFDTFPESGVPLTDNGIHLNDDGYKAIARIVVNRILPPPPAPWRLTVVAHTHGESPEIAITAEGTAVTAATIAGDAVRFEAQDAQLLNAIDDRPAPQLRIDGLPAGIYALTIDGQTVLEASAAEWAQGIDLLMEIAAAPAETLRQTVLDKCERHFFRWRAHNGEYIYGRRAASGGGNAGNPQFKDEHAEMDRNIAALDAKIAEHATPQPRVFELKRLPQG